MSPAAHYLIALSVMLSSACERSVALQDDSDRIGSAGGIELARLWAQRSDGLPFAPTQPVTFPADWRPHPRSNAESFQLRAILRGSTGDLRSVQVQLDRLALGTTAVATSQWGFNELMRSSIAAGSTGQARLLQHERIQRRALDLADSDRYGMHVDATVLRTVTDVLRTAGGDGCRIRYRLSVELPDLRSKVLDDPWQLAFVVDECPQLRSLGNMNQWLASDVDVTATNSTPGSADWAGHAWISHAWGTLPGEGGAVVIDQLQLRLEDAADSGSAVENEAATLTATRSKRRSGRGPQSVEGTITERDGSTRTLSLHWTDEGNILSDVSGLSYPQRFRLKSDDGQVALLLTPMVALPEIDDSLGMRWSGAVIVSGSHSGVGFVDFRPLGQDELQVSQR